jgi:hypothetical protein
MPSRSSWLIVTLMIWWVLLGGVFVWLLPERVAAAPGQRAYIRQPGIRDWPVPTTRLAFEEFQRGTRESDESAIEGAFAAAEWLTVNHGDEVQIVTMDGEIVEVELLDGWYAGRRVWLMRRQLTVP